jgi:spore coat polysaccharide biosynthesis protein SpsF
MKKVKNILIVIQARMGSSRLYGKVMKKVCSKPLLYLMIERVQYSKYGHNLLIATTEEKEDDIIESLCRRDNVKCFRGSRVDLLDRHFKAALWQNADIVVKIPSDCPLIDPSVIDRVIEHFIRNHDEVDYVSNLHPPTYPDGNDVEVMSFNALHRAWKHATLAFEREHTTPYIWMNTGIFRISNVVWESGLDYSKTYRFTLDYQEDFDFIKAVYEELYDDDPLFSLNDILELLKSRPFIRTINSMHCGKSWLNNLADINYGLNYSKLNSMPNQS